MSKIHKQEGKTKTSWKIWFYTPEGRLKSKTFDSHKEAKDYQAKVQVSKKENRYHDVFDVKRESQTTFNQLADEYVENFGTQKGFKSNKAHIIRELRQRFGAKKLSQITYLDLETYRNKRKATPTKGGKIRADGSVNNELATFHHMLSKAVEWEMLEINPFSKGKKLLFRLDNQRTRFLSEQEIEALLSECVPHLKPIVEVAMLTGMRRGEILSLRWEQIRNGSIYLEAAMCKGNKGRQIPISDRLAGVLR